jgi:ATP-binding cassette subfamily B protein
MNSDKYHKFRNFDLLKILFDCSPGSTVAEWVFAVVFSFLPAIQTVAVKGFIDKAVDIYNNNDDVFSIVSPLLLMLLVFCARQMNSVMMYVIERKQKKALNNRFETEILKKRARLRYCYIENNDVWDLINRTCSNASNEIYDNYINIINFIQNILKIASLIAVIISYVWWAGLLLIVVCTPMIPIAAKAGITDYKAYEESNRIERKADYLHSTLTGREAAAERNLFGYKDFLQKKWLDHAEKSRKHYIKALIGNTFKLKLTGMLITLIFVGMTGLFTYMLLVGHISASVVIAVIGASNDFINVFTWNLSENMLRFTKSKEYLADLTVFWNLEEIKDSERETDKEQFFDSLELKNVSFKYPDTNRYVLKNLSLRIDNGRHYAIVGENGCGKTTLIKLLTGLYDEYEGEILLNGRELRDYSQGELKRMFSVVFQDFARYDLSISENIRFGNKPVIDKKYDSIIKMIGLDRLVKALPDKEDTLLGKHMKNGIDLSGGEWQKIAISRSMYKGSPVMILDEPTAALDPTAESKVYSLFQDICKNNTTLVITHRLGAAKISDEIIVLADGCVAELGNHESLMKHKGLYHNMFVTQRRYFE